MPTNAEIMAMKVRIKIASCKRELTTPTILSIVKSGMAPGTPGVGCNMELTANWRRKETKKLSTMTPMNQAMD